jgi:LysM repeat protein
MHDAARLKQGSSVMTRENKLVMVIGFGFMLFLGILVSDHLAANSTPLKQPLVSYTPEPVGLPGVNQRFGEAPLPVGPDGLPVDQTRGIPVVLGGSEFGGPVVPAAPVVAKERTHTLAKGEYPETLALKYYGKRALGAKLAEFNNIDPKKLKVGQELKIPDITVLDPSLAPTQVVEQGTVVHAPINAPISAPRVDEVVVNDPIESTPKFGKVKIAKGDTLYTISKKVYGNGSRWEEIAKLNNLGAGKSLRLGAEIKYALAN